MLSAGFLDYHLEDEALKNYLKQLQFLLGGLVSCVGGVLASDGPNVDGKWSGQTRCPMGLAVFTIEIQGEAGMLSHGGYGPERVAPLEYEIKPAFMKGWEGSWVYFKPVDQTYHGSFAGLNGLISANGQAIEVRSQTGLGDCKPFVLSREVLAVPKPITDPEPKESVDRREPTESEMRQAVEQSITTNINNPINGMSIYVVDFKKRACQKAVQKPGYTCDYYVHTDHKLNSNEGTAGGQQHADALQTMLDRMMNSSRANKVEYQGRFLYVATESRWVRVDP